MNKEMPHRKTELGFTLSVHKRELLDKQTSIGLDRDSRLAVQPNLRTVKCQQNLVIRNPSEPVGRDSHLDTKPSILENWPTEMIQFAQTLGAIGLNMPATSNLRYNKR